MADGTVYVRYLIDDVDAAADFYVTHLGFELVWSAGAAFAEIARGNLHLLLSGPASSAARPMPDGRQPEPGGWNRIHLLVDDIAGEVERLGAAGVVFRSEIVTGPAARRSCSTIRRGTRSSCSRRPGRVVRLQLELTHFTDPACPFAFSAEPVRMRLRWHYGDQLVWRMRMIVLTLEPGEAERLAEGAPNLQRIYGMPIDPVPYKRTASSEPACRAVVATRIHAPGTEERLLRRLRVRVMQRGLLDDPELIAAAARDAGLDPAELDEWCRRDDVEAELQADIEAARNPHPAARALDHKLGGPHRRRRYTAPSYELTRSDGVQTVVPGFNPVEAYEVAIANLAPDLVRQPKPKAVAEVLAWSAEPLATAEVALIAQLDPRDARVALSRVATPIAAGADFYWTLTDRRQACSLDE